MPSDYIDFVKYILEFKWKNVKKVKKDSIVGF